jgi:uncharacterized protein YbjT (DUF2867 family)
VVQQLRDDGIPVRAMTRNPATITPTEQVDAVLGDFQDPATTAAGLHGVDAIFVMSPVASIVDHTKIAVDVARRGAAEERCSSMAKGSVYRAGRPGSSAADIRPMGRS